MEAELDDAENVILDGFPRTIPQAEAFDALLARKGFHAVAVVFDVDYAVLTQRITGRWSNPRTGRVYHATFNPPKVAGIDDEDGGPLVQREDDRAEVVAKRLAEYDEKTAPLVAYYERQRNAIHVNGLGEIDDVARAIVEKLPDVAPLIVNDP
jgi:adenylate kinase